MLYTVKVEFLVNVDNEQQINGYNGIFEDAKIRGSKAHKILDIHQLDQAEIEKFYSYFGGKLLGIASPFEAKAE